MCSRTMPGPFGVSTADSLAPCGDLDGSLRTPPAASHRHGSKRLPSSMHRCVPCAPPGQAQATCAPATHYCWAAASRQ